MGKLCIKIDLDLCQGHGVCQAEAGEVFELQESDAPYPQAVVIKSDISIEEREKVLKAEKFCPNAAITVTEE
ncbi:ferredoxin [Litorivivens sp.]|uniref:ferredoxin n=1 Tax=Litorivivens sp. TaxID=2020868 RepID=UPI0035641519